MAILRGTITVAQPSAAALSGTGDGNRTHASSLGSSRSTIELHPRWLPIRL